MKYLKILKTRISKKKKELLIQNNKKNLFFIFIKFFLEIIIGFYRILMAKFYLRNVTKLGKLVSIKNKPLIKANGKIYIGDNVRIWSFVNKTKLLVDKNGTLKIGENSRINSCHISVSNFVEIGKNVRIAPGVLILDSDYHLVENHFSEDGKNSPIIIEDDVWLAMRCIILKGVKIGKSSVVAAGSVVTKNVPPNCVVAGVPAKIIKKIK